MIRRHIASPYVNIDGRVIQRCAVCGLKLVDSKNVMTSDDKPIGTWAPFAVIEIEEGNPMRTSLVETEPKGVRKIPENLCLNLVED